MGLSIDYPGIMAETPISSVQVASDYVWMKMHGQGSGANTILDEGGILGDMEITNNTPLDWTTDPGWLNVNTASGANGYLQLSPTAAQLDFFRLHTLTTGCIIISCEVQCPDVLVSGNNILCYGNRPSGDANSWSFGVNLANKANIVVFDNTATAYNLAGDAMTPGERRAIGCIIDVDNLTLKTYDAGVQSNSKSFVLPTADTATQAWSFLSGLTAVATSNEFGEGATTTSNDVLIRDVKMFRIESDISSQHDTLMADLANYSTEMPYSFNGL